MAAAVAGASKERRAQLRPPLRRRGHGCPSRRLRGHSHGRKKVGEASPPAPAVRHRHPPLDGDPASASSHLYPRCRSLCSSPSSPSSEACSTRETMLMLILVNGTHAPPTWRARCRVSKPRYRGNTHPLVRSMMGCREFCCEERGDARLAQQTDTDTQGFTQVWAACRVTPYSCLSDVCGI